MSIFKRKSKPTKQPLTPKPLEVFVYNLMLDRLNTPSEFHLYSLMERSSSEYELWRLLGAFKVPFVGYLLGKIHDKRYVCICADTETARALWSETLIGGCCVLGENLDVDEENVNRFNNGDVEHLFITPQARMPELKDVEAIVIAQPSVEDMVYVNSFAQAMKNAEHPKLYFFAHHDTIDDVRKKAVMGISPTVTETDFPYKRLTHEKSWTATSFTQSKAHTSVPSSTSTKRQSSAGNVQTATSSKSQKRANIGRGS